MCISRILLSFAAIARHYLVTLNENLLNKNIGIFAPTTIPKMMNAQVNPLNAKR